MKHGQIIYIITSTFTVKLWSSPKWLQKTPQFYTSC